MNFWYYLVIRRSEYSFIIEKVFCINFEYLREFSVCIVEMYDIMNISLYKS